MNPPPAVALSSCGHSLDLSEGAFGTLESSADLVGRPEALRRSYERNGYLYLPGFFDREEVMAVRASLTGRLAAQGLLDPDRPEIDAVWNPEKRTAFKPDLADGNTALQGLAYGPRLLGFYEAFFGEPVLHFDFTWIRAVGPGHGTPPHCDWVYMGRGSRELMTCWIPYGDVSLDLGGLILLEGSHRQAERIRAYLETDVDSYCSNRPGEVKKVAEEGGSAHRGWLSSNPASLRQKFGGRWLTADWKAGDLVTFRMDLIHASLDNRTDRIRLSSDTRYQPASQPADGRWIGPDPAGHSKAGKLGRIC